MGQDEVPESSVLLSRALHPETNHKEARTRKKPNRTRYSLVERLRSPNPGPSSHELRLTFSIVLAGLGVEFVLHLVDFWVGL